MPEVCWHTPGLRHWGCDPDELVMYGRCRSGRRWFWAAILAGVGTSTHGWADSEQDALDQARHAVPTLAPDRRICAILCHGVATQHLKRVNLERRRTTTPSGASDAGRVEYLYGIDYSEGLDGCIRATVVRFRVVKRTARRIYYVRREASGSTEPEIGFVDRQRLEADGEVCNRGRGWYEADYRLYLQHPDLDQGARDAADELAKARIAMFYAHPDHGGNSEAFRVARERYVKARRAHETRRRVTTEKRGSNPAK